MKFEKKKMGKIVRLILSLIVIAIMIRQIFLKEWFMVFACIFTLIVFAIPRVFDKKFNIKFPMALEIAIYLFVFGAEIIGEIGEYYINVSWWDDLLHTVSGMLLAAVGLFFISVLNNENKRLNLPVFYKVFATFCFSITILALWECFEFGADCLTGSDMQKDTFITTINSVDLNEKKVNKSVSLNIETIEVNGEDWMKKYGGYLDIGLYDTMYDLLDGLLGASIYSIFSYFYLKKKQYN